MCCMCIVLLSRRGTQEIRGVLRDLFALVDESHEPEVKRLHRYRASNDAA